MGRAPLRAGDGLWHRSGTGACGPAPTCQDAGGLQPDLLTVRVRCADLDTSSAAASGASKTACASTCTWVPNKYKKAGTCA